MTMNPGPNPPANLVHAHTIFSDSPSFEEPTEVQNELFLDQCPTGIAGHRWVLRIYEGQIILSLAEGEQCPRFIPGPEFAAQPASVQYSCEWSVNGFEPNLFCMEGTYAQLRWRTGLPRGVDLESGIYLDIILEEE